MTAQTSCEDLFRPVDLRGHPARTLDAVRDLLLDIDPAMGRRAGLEQAIREAIRGGRLAAGSAMPSTRALATDQGLSRSTVVAAYEQLSTEGYLIVKQGAATLVAEVHVGDAAPDGRQVEPNGGDIASTAGSVSGIRPSQRAVDFRPGEPDGSLFPRAAWMRSLRRVITDSEDDLFSYGDPLGHRSLRIELSGYLGRSRAVSADPSQVSIFGGATASASFIGELFARMDITAVAMEDPGSFLIRTALELVGMTVVPMPMDDEGLRVDLLDRSGVGAVVVTPANQYPTGVTMSPARRSDLLRWARDRKAWIVEDDYDGEFRYDRQTIGALQGLDPERVLYIGTASKSLSPGLRLSWLVVPAEIGGILAAVKHLRGAPSSIDQVCLGDFIATGELDRHLRQVRKVYQRRHEVVHRELTSAAPWLQLPAIAAGLHLAATIRSPRITERRLVEAAAASSIRLLGFKVHWMAAPASEGVVLGFSRLPEHSFAAGVERLGDFLGSVADR